jgi:hypothetical protein
MRLLSAEDPQPIHVQATRIHQVVEIIEMIEEVVAPVG